MQYYKKENLWFFVRYGEYYDFYNYRTSEKMINYFDNSLMLVSWNYPLIINTDLIIKKLYNGLIRDDHVYSIIYNEYLTRKNFK